MEKSEDLLTSQISDKENFLKSFSRIDIRHELIEIQNCITSSDIDILNNFGKKVTRYRDLHEKYWHLTENYNTIATYRPCGFYNAHTDKNNILNTDLSPIVLNNLKSLHKKILEHVKLNAFTMYPAYVTSLKTPNRERLPIHTHNTHKFIERENDTLLSLSFSIRMTNFSTSQDSTRLRFYTPKRRELIRLEEEVHSDVKKFAHEFQPENFSVYAFNTENSPHTAICGENLYCWLVFDYVKFNFPFNYDNYLLSKNILSHHYF